MTDEELKEIEERASKASPRPWRFRLFAGGSSINNKGDIDKADGSALAAWIAEADAAFVVSAREDIPALLAEVKRLKLLLEDHQ